MQKSVKFYPVFHKALFTIEPYKTHLTQTSLHLWSGRDITTSKCVNVRGMFTGNRPTVVWGILFIIPIKNIMPILVL